MVTGWREEGRCNVGHNRATDQTSHRGNSKFLFNACRGWLPDAAWFQIERRREGWHGSRWGRCAASASFLHHHNRISLIAELVMERIIYHIHCVRHFTISQLGINHNNMQPCICTIAPDKRKRDQAKSKDHTPSRVPHMHADSVESAYQRLMSPPVS
jgi:hypothetical protein